MRLPHPGLSIALTLAALAAPASAQETAKKAVIVTETKTDDDKPVVILDTTAGPITLELDRTKTPITVDNFLKYVDSHYYDGLVFHRVIPGFMVQGGGWTMGPSGAIQKKKATFDAIKNESKTGLSNARGTVAMARTDNPNSATCEFFINHANNARLDTYGGGYTAFGKVTDGMDVVDAIAKGKTDLSDGEGGAPEKPVVIKTAKRKAKS